MTFQLPFPILHSNMLAAAILKLRDVPTCGIESVLLNSRSLMVCYYHCKNTRIQGTKELKIQSFTLSTYIENTQEH